MIRIVCVALFTIVIDRISYPPVILDTESNDVQTLTRQVADSLTPPNASHERINIEQELLAVLRGHNVISKANRRSEKRSDMPATKKSENHEQTSTTRSTRPKLDDFAQQTTDAFS
jgi:hypothetical protein